MFEKSSMVLFSVPGDTGRARGLWAIGFWEPADDQKKASFDLHAFLSRCSKGLIPEPVKLPRPQNFVDPSWDPAERDMVISYLRQGRELQRYMGYSHCRFRCGISDADMGDADLTDGTFVWPEGFAHYLEKHGVRPGQNFVNHVLFRMRRIGARS